MDSVTAQFDRDWEAFRYVQGEMSADEQTQFEELLAVDSELCLSVANQYLLCDAIRMSGMNPVSSTNPLSPLASPSAFVPRPQPQSAWWSLQRLVLSGWAVTTLALAGLVAFLIQDAWTDAKSEIAVVVDRFEEPTPSVLVAWSELQPMSHSTSGQDPVASDNEFSEANLFSAEVSNAVPDWMLVAAEPLLQDLPAESGTTAEGTL